MRAAVRFEHGVIQQLGQAEIHLCGKQTGVLLFEYRF